MTPFASPERQGRKRRGGLFVNDTEICERLNVPEREGMRVLKALDDKRDSGFPPKIEAWGNRRYWPAVQAFFDRAYGMSAASAAPQWDRQTALRRAVNGR